MPQIRRGELGIEAAKLEEKSARAGFFPSISLSASVGTGHMSNNDFESGSQIWNRFNENVGLTLNIPIFSNRKNRTAVNKAKIALNDSYPVPVSLGPRKGEIRPGELRADQRTVPRRSEKHRRADHGPKRIFGSTATGPASQISHPAEYRTAQHLSGASCERHLLIRTSGFRQAGPHRRNR